MYCAYRKRRDYEVFKELIPLKTQLKVSDGAIYVWDDLGVLQKDRILRLELHKAIVFIFFVLFLGTGVFLVKDYGIPLDEAGQRAIGVLTIDYVVKGDQGLLQYGGRDHGPFFEVVLVLLEKGFHLADDIRAVHLMRHLATFLMFYLGVIFFYKLCKKIFHSWPAGLCGSLFLILSPRIFADAFYNSKDIPCLSLFIISTYTLINYLEHRTLANAFIHALTSCVLIDIRIVGIIIPLLTLLFVFLDMGLMPAAGTNLKKVFLSVLAYGFFLMVLTILFWPFLWASPLKNFFYALSSMSHFRLGLTVLYLGQYIKDFLLPWHYIPVWIAVSTPLVYVMTFCIGYLKTIMLAGKNPAQFYRHHKSELIVFLLISLPVLAVILMKSVVYDAWRQMFFVYPFFLVISLIGLRALWGFVRGKTGGIFIQTMLISLIVFNLSSIVVFMVRNHPFQNVYFNILAGRNMKEIKTRFDLDYWGLSFTKVFEHIVTHDPDPFIKVYVDGRHYVDGHPEVVPTGMLKGSDIERIVFVNNAQEAKYFLSDYRWHKEEYPYKNEYYAVRVDGTPIAIVYRLQ